MLWRASLLALGREAAPITNTAFPQLHRILSFWGRFAAQREQARSPQSASPSSPVAKEASVGEGCFCGEQACPALGCAAAPDPGNAFFQAHLIGRFWGRFAAQREQARSPQSASPSSPVVKEASVGERGFCGEQACPALGCAAAPSQATRSFRQTSLAGFGAASQPNASLLWRASLLALGREAALLQTPRSFSYAAFSAFGAASQPNASKLARHPNYVRHQSPCFCICQVNDRRGWAGPDLCSVHLPTTRSR